MSGIVFIASKLGDRSGVDGVKYYPDCVMKIQHKFSNQVTPHAVEDGEPVTNHIQRNNNEFIVEGIYSPFNFRRYEDDELEQGKSRVQEAYNFLEGLLKNRSIVTVVSKWNVYPDCTPTALDIDINPDDGNNLRFTISFTQIRKAFTNQVNVVRVQNVVPDKKDDAAMPKKKGLTYEKGWAESIWDFLFAEEAKDAQEIVNGNTQPNT